MPRKMFSLFNLEYKVGVLRKNFKSIKKTITVIFNVDIEKYSRTDTGKNIQKNEKLNMKKSFVRTSIKILINQVT